MNVKLNLNENHQRFFALYFQAGIETKPLLQTASNNSVDPSTNVQTESNTLVSTAVSSIETKDSEITSIPSEAPIRDLVSVGSDSILPLIEETFESSVTGNRGGDLAKEQPFRKHARCSAQNHFDAVCSECESIENNLKQENGTENAVEKNSDTNENGKEVANRNDEKLLLLPVKPSNHHSASNENVWQVAHIDKYNPSDKFTLSPLTVCSAQTASTLTNSNCLQYDVDSTSFIVLHDENENASHFLPNISNNETSQTKVRNAIFDTKNTFDRPCKDCCFCNPTLHHKRRIGNDASPKKCNFCSSRQQSTQTTPATSKYQDKSQSTNDVDASARSSIPIERIYESKYRSNHTHIRTHSRDSDTVNTQCTKKTNRKVRKTLLGGSDDRLNANSDNTNPNKANETNGNEVNGNNKASKLKSSIPKLPPASNHEWITNSMDSATSPSSSNSTGSSNKSNRRQNSKSVPNLPRTERWQTAETNSNSNSNSNTKQQNSRTNSRYQNFYGNGTASATDERTAVTSSESKSKSKHPGIFYLFEKCTSCVNCVFPFTSGCLSLNLCCLKNCSMSLSNLNSNQI